MMTESRRANVKWVLVQDSTQHPFVINPDFEAAVGRSEDAEFCLRSKRVSRNHGSFLIHQKHYDLYVKDLGSNNGTYINGLRIPNKKPLRVYPGDVVSFGLIRQQAEVEEDKQCCFVAMKVDLSLLLSDSCRSGSIIDLTNITDDACIKEEEPPSEEAPMELDSDDTLNVKIESTSQYNDNPPIPVEPNPIELNDSDALIAQLDEAINDIRTNTRNSASITGVAFVDLTADDDDNIDIPSSRIYQMSQSVKIEPDLKFQQIKNELAEMDFTEHEIIVNHVPIDLEETGFNCTQDIANLLEEEINAPPALPPPPSIDIQPVKRARSESSTHCDKRTERKSTSKKAEKKATYVKEKLHPEETAHHHDKHTKITKNPKRTTIDPQNYQQQDLMKELKRRRSRSEEVIDREVQKRIREERKKKLQELAHVRSRKQKDNQQEDEDSNASAELLFKGRKRISRLLTPWPKNATTEKQDSAISQPRRVTMEQPKNQEKSTARLDQPNEKLNTSTSILPAQIVVSSSERIQLTCLNDIFAMMVKWQPAWLLRDNNETTMAPLYAAVEPIPTSFTSFGQYFDILSKLVLMETWEYVFKDYRDSKKNLMKSVKIVHVTSVDHLTYVHCEYYMTNEEIQIGHFFKPEDFVLMEYGTKNQNYTTFGIIEKCTKSAITDTTQISVQRARCSGLPHNKLEFTIITSLVNNSRIRSTRLPLIHLVSNVRSNIMLIRAIFGLVNSPLCTKILMPKFEDFIVERTHKTMLIKNNLNNDQARIVLEAASLCTGQIAGIYCVKGPPGTGKSTVIVNTIFQILLSYYAMNRNKNPSIYKPPLILLAAPSNAAVDSLFLKITSMKRQLDTESRHLIKCVRIGPPTSVHPGVLPYTMPKLAEKYLYEQNRDKPEMKHAKATTENIIEATKRCLGDQYKKRKWESEQEVIEKSNIICTTLKSSINNCLRDAVQSKLVKFTCCIMDESTQCHEVETILPTVLGIDKIVMIGDPQQLNATILNKTALKLNFGQSLFARFTKNFQSDSSPIRMLTTQYRMHPEVCHFPNKAFYGGQMKSVCTKVKTKLKPYMVFNFSDLGHTERDKSFQEANSIKQLLTVVLDLVGKDQAYRIGVIITPCNNQIDLIRTKVDPLTKQHPNCHIDVNTVDRFQGSECDIIILSCLRDNANTFMYNVNRLNVALTRAKVALYVIGNYNFFKAGKLLIEMREDAKQRKLLVDVKKKPADFDFKYFIVSGKNQ